ncbi:MAG: hypothetical protein D6683_01595 [Actinomyces sp.]|nr:MAG: hypothetical protein D6683_01595 [Actinomyces sp.]
MAEVLTPDWLTEVVANAARLVDPTTERLVVGVELVDVAPDRPGESRLRRWQIRVGDGEISVSAGGDVTADVTIRTDAATAAAIAGGELSAPRAFLDGRLRLAGDLARLLDTAT